MATLGLTGTLVSSSTPGVVTAAINNGQIDIVSVGAGTATITVTDGTNNATIEVTVAADGTITLGTITKHIPDVGNVIDAIETATTVKGVENARAAYDSLSSQVEKENVTNYALLQSKEGIADEIKAAKDALNVEYDNTVVYDNTKNPATATGSITLPTTGENATVITWVQNTDAAGFFTLNGNIVDVKRSTTDNSHDNYILTATISKGGISDTKDITVTVFEGKKPSTSTPEPVTGNAGIKISFTMNELGTSYLVKDSLKNDILTAPNPKAYLDTVSAGSIVSMKITTTGSNIMDTTGLSVGSYLFVSVDNAGNLSNFTTNLLQIN